METLWLASTELALREMKEKIMGEDEGIETENPEGKQEKTIGEEEGIEKEKLQEMRRNEIEIKSKEIEKKRNKTEMKDDKDAKTSLALDYFK